LIIPEAAPGSGARLTKKIRSIVDGQRIDFEIIEQTIRYASRIMLKGGAIQVEPHDDDDTCSVQMLTRYELRGAARLIPRACIDYVIAAMHKIVIRDMQARLAPSPAMIPVLRDVLQQEH
jgi:hypothetical protein